MFEHGRGQLMDIRIKDKEGRYGPVQLINTYRSDGMDHCSQHSQVMYNACTHTMPHTAAPGSRGSTQQIESAMNKTGSLNQTY